MEILLHSDCYGRSSTCGDAARFLEEDYIFFLAMEILFTQAKGLYLYWDQLCDGLKTLKGQY